MTAYTTTRPKIKISKEVFMKKIKIEIKSWLNCSVLFEYESNDNTIKQTLEKAVSKGANLRYANLRDADLRYANLRYANLRYADLRDANLRYADLRDADLRDADLRDANLRYANLRDADLRYADLRDAKNINSDHTDYWWHIHHERLYEYLTEPIRARINYIKKEKLKEEVELRLKLLKPVLGKIPTTEKGWEALHKKECDCAWDGKTIFPKTKEGVNNG